MLSIFRRWNCWKIVSNDRYIAALGSGVTILNRVTHEILHHFTEIRNVHDGLFVDTDTLVVFTGEQKLFVLQISEKKLLWQCPRPRQLATTGDMRCCQIPGTLKVACIASGKQGINDYYYLLIDCSQQTVHLHRIPNCYRVVHSLNWVPAIGLTFLSYQAKGDGNLLYRIIGIDEDGISSVLSEWESLQHVNAYSGNYLFMNDRNPKNPCITVYKVTNPPQSQKLVRENALEISVPIFRLNRPVGANMYLPSISWVDENAGLFISRTDSWLGVYNFFNGTLVMEYKHSKISCGTIIDGKLLIGCLPGLWTCNFDSV